MEQQKPSKFIPGFLLGVLLTLTVYLVVVPQKQEVKESEKAPVVGGAPDLNYFTEPTTSTVKAVGPTPLLVVPADTARNYLALTNNSDTAMEVSLGGPKYTTSSYSGRINANGGTYIISAPNLYVGDVFVSSSASGKALQILGF